MIFTVPKLLATKAASPRRLVLVHVALEAGIGAKTAAADWALKWTIS